MSETRVVASRLRGALDVLLSSDGNASLLGGGSGREHLIRTREAADRGLLQRVRSRPAATTLCRASALVGAMRARDALHLRRGDGAPPRHERAALLGLNTLETRWAPVERDPHRASCGS